MKTNNGGESVWWIILYKLVGIYINVQTDIVILLCEMLVYICIPYLSTIRHTGNTSTAVITFPHTGNKDSDRLVQSGKANNAGSYMALQMD